MMSIFKLLAGAESVTIGEPAKKIDSNLSRHQDYL